MLLLKKQTDWYCDYIAFDSKIKDDSTLDFITNITEEMFQLLTAVDRKWNCKK